MSRVLLVAATAGYQTRSFESTIRDGGHELLLATDRCHVLDDPWGDNAIPVRFDQPEAAAQQLASLRPDAVVAVGDAPTAIAAAVAERLSLRYHSPEAVARCRNKYEARECFRKHGLPVPEYFRVPIDSEAPEAARSAIFPCVLKPLTLSGSRGVIRANDEVEFIDAFERIRDMGKAAGAFIQVERFIPGREFAIEGIVTEGRLHVFAIFDKPDPLDGPFFEETIYVTPSRESDLVQEQLVRTTQYAVEALGLNHGPIHAEMRYNDEGVWMLEVAARPIGGLCSRVLHFENGISLEQVLVNHALGEGAIPKREQEASAVMMIPIPQSGIYSGTGGVSEAKKVGNVEDVIITAKEGQRLLQLPEGSSYLGFIFARAALPDRAEIAVREAHQRLRFSIMPVLPVLR